MPKAANKERIAKAKATYLDKVDQPVYKKAFKAHDKMQKTIKKRSPKLDAYNAKRRKKQLDKTPMHGSTGSVYHGSHKKSRTLEPRTDYHNMSRVKGEKVDAHKKLFASPNPMEARRYATAGKGSGRRGSTASKNKIKLRRTAGYVHEIKADSSWHKASTQESYSHKSHKVHKVVKVKHSRRQVPITYSEIGAGVAVGAAGAYGVHKYRQHRKQEGVAAHHNGIFHGTRKALK